MSAGKGITIHDVKESLREAGYEDLITRSEFTRQRQEFSRQELEEVRAELLERGKLDLLDDLDIFMAYTLGWTSALRKHLDRRSSADKNRKLAVKAPKKEKREREVIDFSLGDPVSRMYPE